VIIESESMEGLQVASGEKKEELTA
jgi:hypothetical protein